MPTILRKLGNEAGAEIAEAAMVLPIVFMFLLGIVWFGRAFNIYSTITQAAQQGAITAARATCATCPSGNTFPNNDAVDNAIYAVMQASHLDPNQIQLPTNPPTCGGQPCSACAPSPPWPPGGGCTTATGGKVYVCQNVQLNPTPGNTQPLQCGTVVSFQYPFQFYLPFTSLNQQQIMMSAQAQSRMEN